MTSDEAEQQLKTLDDAYRALDEHVAALSKALLNLAEELVEQRKYEHGNIHNISPVRWGRQRHD